MFSRGYGKTLFFTVLVALFVSQGCGGRVLSTPLTTAVAATKTINPAVTKVPFSGPTTTSTVTPDYVATQNFIETDSVSAVISTVQPEVLETHPSPDRKWRVDVIRYSCINYSYGDYIGIIAYEQLKIVHLSDGTEKIVDDQLQNCDGIGGGGLTGLYWSPNNRYFYYSDWRAGHPETCGNYVVPTIYRLDTSSEETIMVGGGHISPDKTKLAMWQGNEIVIWDLDNGEVGRVSPLKPDLYNGRIMWADSTKMIEYLQTEWECAPDYGKSYITRLDLTDFSQSLIAEYDSLGTEVPVFSIPATPGPAGVLELFFYHPLALNYDPSVWVLSNGIQARNLKNCSVTEQGPTDFNGPHSEDVVRLGEINYTVLSFPDSPPDRVKLAYLADSSLATEVGLPVFWVIARPDEWDECKKLAEDVLSTLH
jgi:hypothetical protein